MLGKGSVGSEEVGLILGRNVSFEGKMTFEGMARLDGKFHGEILSGDVLVIGETAVIDAQIKVGTIIVNGQVTGDVSATTKAEIRSTGKLRGNIDAPTLVIEEGGVFEGSCKMQKGATAAQPKVTPIKEKETEGLQG